MVALVEERARVCVADVVRARARPLILMRWLGLLLLVVAEAGSSSSLFLLQVEILRVSWPGP